jgi:biopolymer transport protein ExbB
MLDMTASVAAMLAQAPPADAAPGPAPLAGIESVWDFIVKGGPVMIPIGLCSLVALAVIVERFISLRRRRVIPPSFVPGLRAVLRNGAADRDAALEYCRRNPSPVSRVLAAGIRRLGDPIDLLERHVQDAGEREVMKLRWSVRVLSVIAALAPLLGLLGTITGMITAFQTVAASADALGRTELLARGIYEAMITTAAGLIVAIPAMIFYHWIAARIDRLVMDIDHLTVEFVEEHALPAARTVNLRSAAGAGPPLDGTGNGAPLIETLRSASSART